MYNVQIKKGIVMDESLNQTGELARELNSAFLGGPVVLEKQLARISDQQYVSLLTLLDEYSTTLKITA